MQVTVLIFSLLSINFLVAGRRIPSFVSRSAFFSFITTDISKTEMPDATCKDFCCSAFATLVDEFDAKSPNLSNKIHLIFRRSNFPFNSDRDYEDLKPVLRLVSLLLQSDAALPWILRLFDGDVLTEDGETISLTQYYVENIDDVLSAPWGVHLLSKSDQNIPSRKNKRRVGYLLAKFADLVTFDVRERRKYDDQSCGGYCAGRDGCLTSSTSQAFPRGTLAYMWINRESLKEMQYLMNKKYAEEVRKEFCLCDGSNDLLDLAKSQSQCSCVELELLLLRFGMADDFLHEVAHAQWRASCNILHELSHSPDSFGENGYALTNQIHGGLINIWPFSFSKAAWSEHFTSGVPDCKRCKPQSISAAAIFQKWPNTELIHQYLKGHVNAADPLSRVPLSHLHNLFQAEFWDKIRADGPEGLKAPRVGFWFGDYIPADDKHTMCTAEETNRLLEDEDVQAHLGIRPLAATTQEAQQHY